MRPSIILTNELVKYIFWKYKKGTAYLLVYTKFNSLTNKTHQHNLYTPIKY